MPASFPSYLYSFIPGRGFGVTPRASHVYVPETCATYQPLDFDTSSWPMRPTATVIRLGPEPSRDAWINKERPGALLVMRGGNVYDAARHGFDCLNLWPLVGFAESRGSSYPPPPIEIGALQVGLAVANAWEKNPRLAVEGPAWALELLAALPGAIIYDTTSSRCDGGHVTAWGRRWRVDRNASLFETAARLAGPSPLAHDGSWRAIGSMLFLPYAPEARRVRVVASDKPDLWNVPTELGVLCVQRDAVQRSYQSGPVVRWPSAEDPWLVDLIGDGEKVST